MSIQALTFARTNITDFIYSDFSSTSGLNLVSTYGVVSNNLYITDTSTGDVGNVWRTTSNRYDRSFELYLNVECSGGSGADGYCVQWYTSNNSNGATGGGCGRINDVACIHCIIFQTYTGSGVYWANANVDKTSKTSSSISFRQNVHYWLSYNHWSQTMDIYYSTSNTKPSSPSHTYTSFVFNSTYYYFGLGAATGGSTDNHIIKSMNLIFTNAQNSTI